MKYIETQTVLGTVSFPAKLVHKLARRIVLSVPGVESLEKNLDESIRIDIRRNTLSFHLFLVFGLAKRVPEVSWNLQRKLKESIEEKTGMRVERIDVHVEEFSILGWSEPENRPVFG